MSALVLAGVVITGAWTQLDEIGLAGWLVLVLIFVFDHYAPESLHWWSHGRPSFAAERAPLIAGVALCLLHVAHVGLTAREEFGFGGDEGYHLSATRAFALYFLRAGPLLAVALVAYAILRYRRWRYAATAAIALLLAASYLLPASALFGRYPAGFYLLATPLNVAFEIVQSPYPYTANHIVNVLSVPCWLFMLRPLVIGRWPDWRVLPVALLVYFQAPALVMAGSTLLEPWALIFLLLALEAAVALDADERWIAVPLCAVATFFKETAILLLPAVWLVACVDWRSGRPAIRRGAIAVGIASVAPFLVFLAVRRGQPFQRGYELAGAEVILGMGRVAEWLANLRAQAGLGAIVAAAAAAAVGLRYGALWVVTAFAIALFFYADVVSVPYTGYARFAAYSLVAVCGAVFAWASRAATRSLMVMSAVIVLLQAAPVMRTFALDLQPDHERNSLEWPGSLIRLPIRTLAARIPDLEGGGQVQRLRVVSFGTDLSSLHVAYPDLAKRYQLVRGDGNADCRCVDRDEAVLAGFDWPAHLGNTAEGRARFAQVSQACVQQIQTTCLSHITQDDRSGAPVGALGLGRVTLLASPQDHQRPQR